MKTLITSNGREVLLDDDDYDRFNKWSWKVSQRGYVCRSKHQRKCTPEYLTVYLHKEIIGASKGQIVDHVDRNPMNCTKNNLRHGNKRLNAYNSKKPSRFSYSRFKGVRWVKHARLWWVNGAGRCFKNEEEAARAYDRMIVGRHGEFAATNKTLGLLV